MEWVCIIVAVVTAETITNSLEVTGFANFLVWMAGWICGYAITLYIIKRILEWKGKN